MQKCQCGKYGFLPLDNHFDLLYTADNAVVIVVVIAITTPSDRVISEIVLAP